MENKTEIVEENKPKKTTKKEEVKGWKEVFKANYEGTSEEAKALKPFLKETFKGDPYIPWAVMERLTRMCDEDAEFINIANEFGGLVHSDMLGVHQKNVQKGEVISETDSMMYAHFVKVKLVFMGKEFVEDYPIQDKDYSSARIYDQSLVNRALQRAKAKVAARGTGLGLRLYEGFDLQFDEKEDKKPSLEAPKVEEKTEKVVKPAKTEQKVEKIEEKPAKVEEKVEEPSAEVPAEPVQVSASPEIMAVIKLIKETPDDKIAPVLQKINVSVMKKYQFALSNTDSDEVLADKLSKFPNIEQFTKTLNNLIG